MILTTTKLNKEQRDADREFSNRVKERDGWRCAICGTDYKVCAHHIVPREIKVYRYELDNAITLCLKHHKFDRVLSAHNAPMAFYLWLQRYHYDLFTTAVERIIKIAYNHGIQLN